MTALRFRIVNVFAETALSGNALAVFEDGSALSDDQMQALALQFNLSETTFVLPSETATAKVRIFTPSFEMPFAGHPTLGTAHVVRSLRASGASGASGSSGDRVTLETRAGVIPVSAEGDVWTLRANPPRARDAEATRAEIATMLGLEEADLTEAPVWIDTGSEQLVVRVMDARAVARCKPDPTLLARHASNGVGASLAYVWTEQEDGVLARFFFTKHGELVEDPGTGSACANLGGWFVLRDRGPVALSIDQGAQTGRRCRLHLRVDEDGQIFVSGRVIEIGTGAIALDSIAR